MASEQTGVRKKQSRNLLREERHTHLYRHQDCIPNSKLLSNCERQTSLNSKSNNELECYGCHGKVVSEPEANDLKNKSKHLNSKVKSDGKQEKVQQGAKINPLQSNGNIGNNEEVSKSRRRRLRKRRLLVSLAPTTTPSVNTKPNLPIENNLPTKPISRPVARPPSASAVPPVSTPTTRSSDLVKPSPKDSRKRPDKSVGSRNKSIKSKSLLEPTTQAATKAELIKSLEEKTLNSLLQTLAPLTTNSSPKKEKPPITHFSFPEKRLSSSESKVDKDGVFYFGETKHQLEKLASSGFSKYNTSPIQEKSEFAQNTELNKNCFTASKLSNLENCVASFNFSSLNNDRLNALAAVQQNLYDTDIASLTNRIENKRFFPTASSDYKAKEHVFKTPVLKDLSQFPIQVLNLSPAVSKPPINTVTGASNSPGIIFNENNPIKTPLNIIQSSEKSQTVKSVAAPILEENLQCTQTNFIGNIKRVVMKSTEEINKSGKTREEIILEREAKKAAKLAAKAKYKNLQAGKSEISNIVKNKVESTVIAQAHADTKLQKVDTKCVLEKQLSFQGSDTSPHTVVFTDENSVSSLNKETTEVEVPEHSIDIKQESSGKSKAELRAERRAKQEAQRAAKAASKVVQAQPKKVFQAKSEQPKPIISKVENDKTQKPEVPKPSAQPKPKLFSHLYQEKTPLTSSQILKAGGLHPAIVRLGVQYAARVVVGSNARCVALLHALKQMVNDYTTPSEKEFSRGLEEELGPVTAYLHQCRPLAVSMTNALRHIKRTLTQLPNNVPDIEARRKICDVIDTYIHEQIDVAGKQICNTVKQKIANEDVILTYGCSSLVYQILVESHLSGTKFRVVIVDGLPWREGREMLRRLVDKGLSCTYVLITAASFIMREASKVLLGAHALLANGYVMSRAGSSQVALLAHCYNVPVLVCCETHKFCERVQTDAFVYNELGEIYCDNKKDKDKIRVQTSLTPLSLAYDITPPDLVSAVVTELAVLPCTSVPVILRIKPSESLM